MKNQKSLLVFSVCLISLSLLPNFLILLSSASPESVSSSILKYQVESVFTGTIKHSIKLENPLSQRITDGQLIVPLIRNETARHYVIIQSIYPPAGKQISQDSSENIYATWTNVIIEGKQSLTVEICYNILSFSTKYAVNSRLIGDYDKSSELYKKYTQPEELIESNHPRIVSTAKSIIEGVEGTHEKVKSIYNFVVAHLSYAIQSFERGALWALENRVGDCSEYSYLFVALCRAVGIPAKIEAGFGFHSSNEITENGHMWAEYYLENYGWIPVDATWHLFDKTDAKHFASLQSIPQKTSYVNFAFTYSQSYAPTEQQTVTIKPSSASIFKNKPTIDNITATVWKIKQAKFVAFLGKMFGSNALFSSETTDVEQKILESEISLQNAIDLLEKKPQTTQSNLSLALEKAEEALENALMTITKILIIFFGILTAIALGIFIFMRKHGCRTKL